jgi:hypothetical protein
VSLQPGTLEIRLHRRRHPHRYDTHTVTTPVGAV